MTLTFHDRAPAPALRRAVFGFLAGSLLGALFVAAVLLFDIGGIASLASRTAGGLSLRDLGMLPVTFGLLGLIAAPTLGPKRRPD